MLFSNPDYPLFLIAVFFLYALSRLGGARGRWARIAVMVLLCDLVFVLVSKDPDTLRDPLGNVLLRLAADYDVHWPLASLAWHWAIGLAVLGGAIALGMRGGGWIASERGQRAVAGGLVAALAIVGATVVVAWDLGALDAVTAQIIAHGHLLVLAILGIGIGAAQVDTYRPLGRVVILFVASSLFYQAWAAAMPGPYRYLLGLLLGTIILDYYLGIWIENATHPGARKALVVVSLCSNLGILFFFKYTDFLTQDVVQPAVAHLDHILPNRLALPHFTIPRLSLILPAGISFHTFQSLSYTIDVYRKQLRATRSPIQFATFVLFFPQLVAGPIVRAQDLLPQLADLPTLDFDRATRGLYRIVVGLFKKIALADTLGISIVDRVFEAPGHFSGLEVLAGVYGYALQIYLDFSAYSDIAIGSAQILGFELPENFRTPYRSRNLQEFWRRWHITLSTWLRDYLYISLGGSRGAPWRTYANLTLTMLLGGLWHGARWTFIVWGALHGLGLAVTRYFQRATADNARAAIEMLVGCAIIAALGLAIQTQLLPADTGTWTYLIIAWLTFTPLWAVLTAWLGREPAPVPEPPLVGVTWDRLPTAPLDRALVVEILRLAMCWAGIGFLVALGWAESWTWIPLAVVTWLLGIVADIVERNDRSSPPGFAAIRRWLAARRHVLAVVLVFHYVCLGWIFFRATSFADALAVLRQLAGMETDHANLVPLVTTALVVGMLCHFFADGTFRWMRTRFVALPPWAQGALLAATALVLRELGHAKLVKFIYFQF